MYQRVSKGKFWYLKKTTYHELLLSAVGNVSMAKLIWLLIDLITDWFDCDISTEEKCTKLTLSCRIEQVLGLILESIEQLYH